MSMRSLIGELINTINQTNSDDFRELESFVTLWCLFKGSQWARLVFSIFLWHGAGLCHTKNNQQSSSAASENVLLLYTRPDWSEATFACGEDHSQVVSIPQYCLHGHRTFFSLCFYNTINIENTLPPLICAKT